jgi:hypothetical protein
MRVDRLLELIDVLRDLPNHNDRHLRMSGWAVYHTDPNEPECGTAACALGWGAMHKPFRDAGLIMVSNSMTPKLRERRASEGMRLELPWETEPHLLSDAVPYYRGHTGFDAAEAFFQLTEVDAITLFGVEHGGKTPADMIAVIRDFLRANDVPLPEKDPGA